MAQETGKILIIHCVRAWDRLLAMRRKLCREYDSCVTWIVHGFRGNAELARQPWRNLLPGTLMALAAWMGLSFLYSLYVENFADYSVLYGSIGTIIVVLL